METRTRYLLQWRSDGLWEDYGREHLTKEEALAQMQKVKNKGIYYRVIKRVVTDEEIQNGNQAH